VDSGMARPHGVRMRGTGHVRMRSADCEQRDRYTQCNDEKRANHGWPSSHVANVAARPSGDVDTSGDLDAGDRANRDHRPDGDSASSFASSTVSSCNLRVRKQIFFRFTAPESQSLL
jgi:hypothetical protein